MGCFDRVLVDAPCSGEGMFRKEEAAVTDWSEETVAMCARRQAEILHSGAEVTDLLAGLRGQKGDGGHGAGLLEVVKTGLVPDMEARAGIGGVVITIACPGNGIFHKGKGRKIVGFQGIEPQRHRPGAVETAQIVVKFIAQLFFQPGQKSFGEHREPPSK